MTKVTHYIRDSYKELTEKVSWPSWDELQQSTMIVLAATLLLTGLVWFMDFVSAGSLNFIYKLL